MNRRHIVFGLLVLALIGLVITLAPVTNRILWEWVVPQIRGPLPTDPYNKSLRSLNVYVGGLEEQPEILKLAISSPQTLRDSQQAQIDLVKRATKKLRSENVGPANKVRKIRYRIYDNPRAGGTYWNVDTQTFDVIQVQGDSDTPVNGDIH